MKLRQRLTNSGLVLMAVAALGMSQIAAKIDDTGLETLGITAADYEAARDEAAVAYNNELVAMGWITAEEAAAENEEGDFARLGRGQYYSGILNKDVFIADSLGISLAEWEAAEAASYEARLAEKVEEGRLTAAEAADRQAVHDFKAGIDEDTVLAQAMGISVAELNEARVENVTYGDLLDELGVTDDEVDAAEDAITMQLVEDAVADGTLTAEQAEQALNGRDGCRNGRGRSRGNNAPTPAPADNA